MDKHPISRYGTGGFLQLATLVKQYRKDTNCAFVVAGDFLGGSSLAVEFQGKNVVEVWTGLVNRIGLWLLLKHEL